jgi:hypothetical protein
MVGMVAVDTVVVEEETVVMVDMPSWVVSVN